MNSTLQCLSHSPVLTSYFLENKHVDEINRTNALGIALITLITV